MPADLLRRHAALAWPALAVILLIGVLALPELGPKVADEEPLTAAHGRIESIDLTRTPNPNQPGVLPDTRVRMLDGPQVGQVIDAFLQGPGGSQDLSSYHVGDEVVVTTLQQPSGPAFVAVSDRWRLPELGALGLLFAAAVVVVGGWRGIRALLALGLTIAIVIRVLIPLVINGVDPVPLAVVTATIVTILTIVLTEGWSRSSVAAILGTATALVVTGLLATIATRAGGFTNAADSDLLYLQTAGGAGLDLRGLLLAAFILGSIGVLDDVTVTQAATVDELAAVGGLRGRALFGRAFNVGRSHIGATVNTLFLAYVGASLPLLVLLSVSRQPTALVVNGETIAIEVVRTLVGSVGIVTAVPLTTAIATWLAGAATSPVVRRRGWRTRLIAPLPTFVGGLVAIALVTAVAGTLIGPVSSGPIVPEPTEPLLGGNPAELPSASPDESAFPVLGGQQPSGEPTLVAKGEPGAITSDGKAVGTATVMTWTITPRGQDGERILARVRYDATDSMQVDPATWIALTGDGDEFPFDAADRDGLKPATLAAGDTETGSIQVDLESRPKDLFLVYETFDGADLFAVSLTP